MAGVLLGLRHSILGAAARRRTWGACAVGAVALGAVALRYAEDSTLTLERTRAFASYVWQFYLPALPGMSAPPFPGWTVRDVFVDRLFGTFGQLDILMPVHVLDALATALLVLVVVALVVAVLRRDALRAAGPAVVLLPLAVVATLGLLHAQAFRGLLEDPSDPVITGRYLLPLLPVAGIGVAALLQTTLRGRAFALAGGAALALVATLQLAALGLMLERFYV